VTDSEATGPAQAATALGLGERLRSARKARALAVSQVAEALHLEESMVLALEEERFEVLGAPVFVRGHLRRYAQLVGLAPDAMLEAYRAAAPESTLPPRLVRPRAEMPGPRTGSWPLWLLAAVLVVGLFVALAGNRRGAAPVAPEEAVGQSLPAPPATLPAPAPGAALPPEQDAGAPGTGEPAPAAIPGEPAEVAE